MKTIYALLDPRDERLRYVGITGDPVRRLRHQWATARSDKPGPLYVWLRELRGLGFKPRQVILEHTNDESRERHWIEQFRQAGVELLNANNGGFSWSGCQLSEEHRAAISAAMTGRVKSDEHRAALSEALTGKQKSAEHRAAMSAQRKGRTVSEEQRAKISAALKGRSLSPEHIAKVAAAQRGKPRWTDEQKAEMSQARRGKPNPRKPKTDTAAT